jgi:hypothetical protein
LTIPDGESDLIKTRWEWQCLNPLDKATVFGKYDLPRDVEFLLEARELPTIVQRDSQHVNICFAV